MLPNSLLNSESSKQRRSQDAGVAQDDNVVNRDENINN